MIKNVRWIFPFKKFGTVRVAVKQLEVVMIYDANSRGPGLAKVKVIEVAALSSGQRI